MPDAIRDAALSEWIDRGLPAGDCVAWELRLRELPYEDMAQVCGNYPNGGIPGGCFIGQDGFGIVYVTIGAEVLMQHELRHWLGECSGLGKDGDHNDERLWYGGVR